MLITKIPANAEGASNGDLLPPAPFIVGAARSGTTMFRLMLDAHPDLAIPRETNFVDKVAARCEKARSPADLFVKTLTSPNTWLDYGLKAEDLRQRIHDLRPFNVSDALRTFYKLYAEKFGKSRWGDKTPNYTGKMVTIQQVLPEARFIHLIRDGRDAALSINKAHFGPSSVPAAARWWRSRIRKARRQVKDLRYYMEIRYEDLVLNTEATLRATCAFIDLPWEPVMLDYWKRFDERMNELQDKRSSDGTIRTAAERRSEKSLTGKPPQKDRIGGWKIEMNDEDKKCFGQIAGELLVDLGYQSPTL